VKINVELGHQDESGELTVYDSWHVEVDDEEGIYLPALADELRMQGVSPFLEAGNMLRIVKVEEAV